MKVAGTFFIAIVLAFSALTQAQVPAQAQDAGTAGTSADTTADTANLADKPYGTIVARNMFGLLPIPPPDTNPPAPPVDPPPKITLNGIMTIFGRDQALYKVAVKPKPGQPAKEDSYVLGEGERQEDVEVMKIDREKNTVTFNNHGTVQDVELVDATSSGAGAAPGGGPGGGPGAMRPGMMSPADRAAMFRSAGRNSGLGNPVSPNMGGNPNMIGNPNGANGSGGLSFGGGTSANNIYHPENEPPSDTTPEQDVLLIEAQRMKFLQSGNPMANLLPTTPLTKQNIQETLQNQGGNPNPP